MIQFKSTFSFYVEELYCDFNYHDQKIWQTLTYDQRKHWTAVSTFLGYIRSVAVISTSEDRKAETLQLSHQSISPTSDTKGTRRIFWSW